ncbi:hypothetical protein AHiyo4_04200 [Arthrobacter sp. Hiyo4]|nr:hypothetical protein AHiyo4_04200 [Arthrobacter sp. Hiyo4]
MAPSHGRGEWEGKPYEDRGRTLEVDPEDAAGQSKGMWDMLVADVKKIAERG